MQHPSTNGAAPRSTRLLLRLAAFTFALFWAGIISGKLHISFGLVAFPVMPELALAFILAMTLGLVLSACLLEEQRRANKTSVRDTTTEGDIK